MPHRLRSAWWHVERCTTYLRWRFGSVRRGGDPHGLDKPLIVSLTSFPPRFKTLPLTLKCLLSQSIRADAVVLWIASEDESRLTDDILSLRDNGLSIRICAEIKSYKKIIPSIEAYPGSFIVTADDDVYYRPTWLEELISAWTGEKSEVICHRAHRICVDAGRNPLPYQDWDFDTSSAQRSPAIFPTGAGGVLYPPGIFDPRVTDKTLFTTLCPTADDIWLYWMMRLNGGTARRLGPFRLMNWPGSQHVSLWSDNLNGRNDHAIARMIERFGLPLNGAASNEPVLARAAQ